MSSSILAPFLAAMLAIAPTPVDRPGADSVAVPDIATMQVDIWPEYDDPRVLVIYYGLLAPGAETPTDFSFIVPAGARIHMAGGIAETGGHLHGDFRTRPRDDGLMTVTYRLEVPEFYMEFYYDPFTGGDERRFTYPVRAPYHIDSLLVRVQQPRRADAFGLVPASDGTVQDGRGFDYGVLRFADVAAGTETPVTVSYTKTDRDPSVVAQDDPGAAPSSSPGAPSPSPWRRARSWILGTLAAGFFAVGFYKLLSDRANEADPPRGARGTRGRVGGTSGTAAPSRFCTECGQRAGSTHRYCGRCGQPLDS